MYKDLRVQDPDAAFASVLLAIFSLEEVKVSIVQSNFIFNSLVKHLRNVYFQCFWNYWENAYSMCSISCWVASSSPELEATSFFKT